MLGLAYLLSLLPCRKWQVYIPGDAVLLQFSGKQAHVALETKGSWLLLWTLTCSCQCLTSLSFPQAGKNWMFNNAKTSQHCELMTSHLRNRIIADGAHFELRLHLIYLTNDVLHHWYFTPALLSLFWGFVWSLIDKTLMCVSLCSSSQRKQQKDLLTALQKVVVPIYATSFLAVEEEKQQKITRVTILVLIRQITDWC